MDTLLRLSKRSILKLHNQLKALIIKAMIPSGYSGTPLAKKLGIKNGFRIRIVNQPDHYYQLFQDLPTDLIHIDNTKTKKDFIHYFAKEATLLKQDIRSLRNEIVPNGMIWISWPKKTSRVPTDITEDIIRDIALKNGLVDIKVCAIDEIWSALKLVIPVKERGKIES